jgi:alpha-glucosidase
VGYLDEPHHNGSSRFVSNPYPQLGERVAVFVYVPHRANVHAVHVRTVVDGEPAHTPAVIDRRDETATWWRATIEAHNPVVRYRFLLTGEPGGSEHGSSEQGRSGYRWLNGAGTHRGDVTDACDFRLTTFGAPPRWTRDASVYQVFPDRFAIHGARAALPAWAIQAEWDDPVIGDLAARSQQIYGGNLAGIESRLDHIAGLGANTVYLTPFFPARSNHRYDATTFEQVDPLLGGDHALASLSNAVHRRGMRIVGDLTTNHTGDRHEWHIAARDDPDSVEAAFYYWREHPDDYVSWLGVSSLPKLNYGSPELARRMFDGTGSVVAKWLRPPFCLDGWRIDVANMTGRYRSDDYTAAVARSVRATMAQVNPEAFLVAEHSSDATADLTGDGWQANMNYSGFSRPVWAWLAKRPSPHHFFGQPTTIPLWSGADVVATMRSVNAAIPWSVVSRNLNIVSSHDTARIRSVVGDSAAVEVAAALLFTMPGIPMTYAGDEIGIEGDNGEDGRRPFPWHRPESWQLETLNAYRGLGAARAGSTALRDGGLRWAHVGENSLAYLRESNDERVLVFVARHPGGNATLDATRLGLQGPAENLYGGADLVEQDGVVALPADGPTAQVWRLPAAR